MDCTYFKNGICVATGTNCIGTDCDGYIADNDAENTPAE